MFKAYVIAGSACASRVREWCRWERSPQHSQVQLFFERGDNWQRELRVQMIDDGHPEPIFKPKKDVYSKGTGELIESGLIPFQAADVLAYLTYLNAKFADRKTGEIKKTSVGY